MSRRKAKRVIALAVGYPSGFEDEIVRGAIEYAEEVETWEFAGDCHRPFMPFDNIDLGAVDGVLGNIIFPDHAKRAIDAGIPIVNTSTRYEDLPLPRVGNDDQAIGRMGAGYFLERGFVNFGFVCFEEAWYGRGRLAGYRQIVEGQTGYACHVFRFAGQSWDVFHAHFTSWIADLPKPVAVMATNDVIARQVIAATLDGGWRVPDDVAVLGVDNDRWATALSRVPISSVQIDARRVGYQAAAMLDKLIAGRQPKPVFLPPIGIETRRSTDIHLQDDPLVSEALGFMREHARETISIDDVLIALDVSRRTLETRLKRAVGLTPQAAIFHTKIERAKTLLTTSESTIGEIALACGFERPERFNVVFKRETGITPGQYRRQLVTRKP